MSASLVGSEMCIRDRPPLRLTGAPIRATPKWAPYHRLPPIIRRPCGDAVSYTHLTLPTICSV
eukprot:754807-Alexandrium_andersonii.AAC.1